jgi:hypothetical protein
MTAPRSWLNFTLGFADGGPDGDTVRHVLRVLHGWTVRVEQFDAAGLDTVVQDVVVDTFDQDDDEAAGFPVFLTGWLFDEAADDADFRGARVRIPLANSKLTIL